MFSDQFDDFLLITLPDKDAMNHSATIHLRSSAFICGSLALGFNGRRR
jgi:hypothetical protein